MQYMKNKRQSFNNIIKSFLCQLISGRDNIIKKAFVFNTKALKSDPARIRTWDPQLRRLLLYPTELLDHFSDCKINKNCQLTSLFLIYSAFSIIYSKYSGDIFTD